MADAFSIEGVVLDIQSEVRALSGKLDAYIELHQARHVAEQDRAAEARATPKASAAGQSLLDDIQHVANAHRETRDIVMHHERTIQRLFGATAFASALGLGTIVLVIVRMLTGEPT